MMQFNLLKCEEIEYEVEIKKFKHLQKLIMLMLIFMNYNQL